SGKLYEFNSTGMDEIFDIDDYMTGEIIEDFDFSDSAFFIATTKGMAIISNKKVIFYRMLDGLPSEFVGAVYYSKPDNCLILGTGERGILKLQFKDCFTFLPDYTVNARSSVCSIINSKSEGILFSDNRSSIYKYQDDTIEPFVNVRSNASLADIDGLLFAGSWNYNLSVLKGKELVKMLTSGKELPSSSVHCSFKDSKGNIWIGTQNGLARGTTLSTIKPFMFKEIQQVVICIYERKDGTICIGGTGGVYLIKDNRIIKHLGKKEGIEGREIRCFYEDEEGKLWIGSYGGGLYCYFNEKLQSINRKKNNALSLEVFTLAKDQFGYLYMSSNQGLHRIKEADLNDYYYNKKQYLVPFYYGEESGILNTEFNGGFQNNFLKTLDNEFLFPTVLGLVKVKPEVPEFEKLKPDISSVLINDTLFRSEDHIFERSTYSIRFDIHCERLINKYNIHYQYKLEGEKSTEWSSLQTEPSFNFKLLPAGKYIFIVRAIDGFNDSAPVEVHYEFEIKPYFYETAVFKGALVIMALILVGIVGRARVNYQRRKIEQRESYRRRILELELNAIQ
ncbi:MAG TPA: two-component regulator propeller domain-containing protein, partial [Bacteroidia bacterium]